MKGNLINWLPVLWMTITSLSGFSQALSHDASGGRAGAMGNATVAFSDFWSVYNNQAGLSRIESITAGINYQNRFLVKELGHNAAGFVLPTKTGVFGASMQYFGYSLFNETKIGLAYARSFGEKFSTGIQLDYFSRHIAEGYGNASAFTFELGIQTLVSEGVILGVHIFNPVQSGYSGIDSDQIPTVFTLGILYEITDEVLIMVESEKDLDYKPLLRSGLEYRLVEQVCFRLGFSTLPSREGESGFSAANLFTFGFGYEWNNLVTDLSASIHQTLGWSPGISLYYKFGKKEQ